MKIILFLILSIGLIPIAHAESFDWKFCNDIMQFPYTITNGTLKETIHFKLADTIPCTGQYSTDYQLQLIHTSNNQTDFQIGLPEELDFEKIKVRIIDRYNVETFWLNQTVNSIPLDNYTHDKFGFITVILDFVGI